MKVHYKQNSIFLKYQTGLEAESLIQLYKKVISTLCITFIASLNQV